MIVIYNVMLFLALVIGLPVLLPLILFSEKRRNTVAYRLGCNRLSNHPRSRQNKASFKRPIWVHALSVGEVLSAAPLLSGIKNKHPDQPVYLTVSTLTGFQLARERLHGQATSVGFFPYDVPFAVKKAIDAVHPTLVVIVETDVWPNFISALQTRNIPLLWVNARLSEHSYRRYKHFSFFFRPVFSAFTCICVQSELDAERFWKLGIAKKKVLFTGNLKYDQDRTVLSSETILQRKRTLGIDSTQPVIVAGSTHNGEEEILLDAFFRLKAHWPSLVLIIAPRDPKRAECVVQLARSIDLKVLPLKAIEENPKSRPDVILIDRLGLLREIYALADIAFVGGSVVPQSGHNPLEPASWGKPVLFGPDMRDFLGISEALLTAGGAVTVADTDAFYREAAALLADPRKAEAMGQIALSIFGSNGGAVEKILAIAAPILGQESHFQKDNGVAGI